MSCLSLSIPHNSNVEENPSKPSPTLINRLVNGFLNDSESVNYRCEKCNHGVAVSKRKVKNYPSLLVVHLMRFSADSETGKKIHTEVLATPVLNIKVADESLQYSLCSIVSHMGEGVNNGHYICDFLHPCVEEQDSVDHHPDHSLPVAETQAIPFDIFTQNDSHVVSGRQEQQTFSSILSIRSRSSYLLFYQLD
eukprot:CAMPEP_0201515992 /NCGR_PEP_ID=MMETSP0161_2-20130828/7419_1 /ASSEMBLY_ACC=CAM_ASM_000251 /TAXON_ID=180227 /ORGANISM="Neoparamoeba aestuarina, Strain SoJaBio B1-5/56/2" /LENGTH=193 /DNA_ID=CAMNT_0047912963 /DNA_START=75 /DNA_END=656 /DNA_ORIENTATION=-